MNMKRFVLAGCATLILGVSTAMAGPCDTSGRAANLKDAGSGPAYGTEGPGERPFSRPPTSKPSFRSLMHIETSNVKLL
jgi:hypothetical protein